jgi:hypothetical protein
VKPTHDEVCVIQLYVKPTHDEVYLIQLYVKPTHGEVYSIQLNVITFVSDFHHLKVPPRYD